jgi:predicted DNA binding CopG/RHH family protein
MTAQKATEATAKTRPRTRPQAIKHIRMDIDTSERIEAIAAYNGIAYGRIINMVMRAYVENNGAGMAVPILELPPQTKEEE